MGAGSWGTVFGQVLCDAGTPAVLCGRRGDLARAINERQENPDYLPGIALTPALRAVTDPAAALDGADLVATCGSPLSRNRAFGENLGRGMSVEQASSMNGQIAEGVKSSESVLALARAHGVEMPITEVMTAVMYEGLPVSQAATLLASRSAKPEWYGSER